MRVLLACVVALLVAAPAADAGVRPAFAVSGAPDADGGRGALVVTPLDGSGGARLYRPQDVGLPAAEPGDRFGAAVASVGAGGDVVVGAPGAGDGRGAVYLVRARRSGRLTETVPRRRYPVDLLAGARTRRLATGFAAGDRFGAGLAVAAARGRFQHLWVGAPGRRGGQGEVTHRLLRGGTPSGPVTTFVPGTPETPGTAADRGFGSTLAPLPRGVLVGLPDAAGPGGEPAAGAVQQLRLRVTGPGSGRRDAFGERVSPPALAAGTGVRFTLPLPAAGDRFGASLSGDSGPGDTVAGAPGADAGGVTDSGVVAVLGRDQVRQVRFPGDGVIPGRPVAGAGFGAGVATGMAFYEQSGADLAVLSSAGVTFADRGQKTAVTVAMPGATSIVTVPPDYEEENAEDALLALDAAGGAATTTFPTARFERSRRVSLPFAADAGRLVGAVPYRG